MLLISKQNIVSFFCTLIQNTYFWIMKTNNFRGDLPEISAEKELLGGTSE